MPGLPKTPQDFEVRHLLSVYTVLCCYTHEQNKGSRAPGRPGSVAANDDPSTECVRVRVVCAHWRGRSYDDGVARREVGLEVAKMPPYAMAGAVTRQPLGRYWDGL